MMRLKSSALSGVITSIQNLTLSACLIPGELAPRKLIEDRPGAVVEHRLALRWGGRLLGHVLDAVGDERVVSGHAHALERFELEKLLHEGVLLGATRHRGDLLDRVEHLIARHLHGHLPCSFKIRLAASMRDSPGWIWIGFEGVIEMTKSPTRCFSALFAIAELIAAA
jgi:hypothetical protein